MSEPATVAARVLDPGRSGRYLQSLIEEALRWGGPAPARTPVSAIIPTTGGPRCGRCLSALRRAAGSVPLEVILVVTGDGGLELPDADRVVRCEPPFCWAKANNAGLRAASHGLVLLLNDDCFFARERDLERLVRRLQVCGHLAAVAPAGVGFAPDFDQGRLPIGSGCWEVDYSLMGACVLLRSEAFWVVGGFDERFTAYGHDEVDWFYRARHCGYRWAVDTEIAVHHADGATFGQRRRAVELSESRALFVSIHHVSPEPGPHWRASRPAVSWVIASRNGAGFLGRCLGSIAANRSTWPPDFEVVLGLDGSTDGSANVVTAFNQSLQEPLPLRLVSFPATAGTAGRAINRVLRLAKGQVILPMDDDDATTAGRGRLASMLTGAGELLVGEWTLILLDGSVARDRGAATSVQELANPGATNWGQCMTAAYRDTWDQFGLHNEALPVCEDLELWLRWMRDGVKVRHATIPVHLYMHRLGSVVSNRQAVTSITQMLCAAYLRGGGSTRMGIQTSRGPVER